jgi:hypothetical protein
LSFGLVISLEINHIKQVKTEAMDVCVF